MFRTKKQLGQNFLINPNIVPEIIKSAEISKGDEVIEIGPGLGILTEGLLQAGAKVFAIEKDFDLISHLNQKFGSNKNIKIIHQDALFFNEETLKNYKVCANLPFNVASPLIRKFLESNNQPELMVVMIQKEVAEKILAKAGDSERGVLTLLVEYYGDAEKIIDVTKENFQPQPKVDATVIKITPKKKTEIEPKVFFKIIKAGFSAKRRQIHNSLSATFRIDKESVLKILKKAKIDPLFRAEDLTLEDWIRLCETFLSDKLF